MSPRYETSAYRTDADRYRAKANDPPEHDMSPEDWRWACLQYAKAYDNLAERHEQAIDAGTEKAFRNRAGRKSANASSRTAPRTAGSGAGRPC